jgi:hypothetical protein
MSLESQVKTALDTVTEFASVRFLVQDAGNDEKPQVLPFCVFSLEVEDFVSFQTMCGAQLSTQGFDVLIYAMSTTECQDLANKSILALTGLGVLAGSITEFEPDLRCYVTTISFT